MIGLNYVKFYIIEQINLQPPYLTRMTGPKFLVWLLSPYPITDLHTIRAGYRTYEQVL